MTQGTRHVLSKEVNSTKNLINSRNLPPAQCI